MDPEPYERADSIFRSHAITTTFVGEVSGRSGFDVAIRSLAVILG